MTASAPADKSGNSINARGVEYFVSVEFERVGRFLQDAGMGGDRKHVAGETNEVRCVWDLGTDRSAQCALD
jgi:hypothetical protein